MSKTLSDLRAIHVNAQRRLLESEDACKAAIAAADAERERAVAAAREARDTERARILVDEHAQIAALVSEEEGEAPEDEPVLETPTVAPAPPAVERVEAVVAETPPAKATPATKKTAPPKPVVAPPAADDLF